MENTVKICLRIFCPNRKGEHRDSFFGEIEKSSRGYGNSHGLCIFSGDRLHQGIQLCCPFPVAVKGGITTYDCNT